MAHGIYPPLLMEAGLEKALSAAAGRSPLPVSVEAASLRRYPTEVEAAAYFCCLEALQNASKHAGEGAIVTVGAPARSGRGADEAQLITGVTFHARASAEDASGP